MTTIILWSYLTILIDIPGVRFYVRREEVRRVSLGLVVAAYDFCLQPLQYIPCITLRSTIYQVAKSTIDSNFADV